MRKCSKEHPPFLRNFQWPHLILLSSSSITCHVYFLSMKGDVQTSVSAMLVLGERGTGLLEEKTVEQWFSSYIGEL